MKQFIVPANGEALQRAIKAIHGQEGLEAINKAYVAIDEAMNFAWNAAVAATEAGQKEAAEDLASENEAQLAFMFGQARMDGYNEGFKAADNSGNGVSAYDNGYEAGATSNQEAFDDGYVEGVSDARMNPSEADDYLSFLCELDAVHAEFDEDNVQDSGDETVERTNAQLEGIDLEDVKYLN